MPDPIGMLITGLIAALAAMAVWALVAAPRWLAPLSLRYAAGCALGVAVGVLIGAWWMQVLPPWPPVAARDRLLAIIVPMVLVIELLAAILPALAGHALRVIGGLALPRIILHNSAWLMDPMFGGWGAAAQQWLLGLGVGCAIVWVLAAMLGRRGAAKPTSLAMAIIAAMAGVSIMLSGSVTSGQIGVPLSASVAGVLAAAWLMRRDVSSLPAVVTPMLLGLLLIGHFFAELGAVPAVLLALSVLGPWVGALPLVRRLRPLPGGIVRVGAALVVAAVAMGFVVMPHTQDPSGAPANGDSSSTIDYADYLR